jgi:uncharacterized protein YfeS
MKILEQISFDITRTHDHFSCQFESSYFVDVEDCVDELFFWS